MIDYKKEILNLLNNNYIKTLPSQDLINEDREIAQAVWQQFTYDYNNEYQDFDLETWYKEGNWGVVLNKYKDDIEFWKEILSFTPSRNVLLNEDFVKDFPTIVNYFLTSNEELKKIYSDTDNEYFFNLLTLNENEKVEYDKELLLSQKRYITSSRITQYEDDIEFVTKILKIAPNIYAALNNKNRENADLIRISLKTRDNFFKIPESYQNKYFNSWYKHYKNSISAKEINNFSEEQQKIIINNSPQLLNNLLNKHFNKYRSLGEKYIVDNFPEAIKIFDIEVLKKYYPSYKEQIAPHIISFIDNFVNVTKLNGEERKYFALIDFSQDFQNELNNNLFDKISNSEEKITLDMLDICFEKLQEMYNTGKIEVTKANEVLNSIRSKLPIEVLKENRFPKNNFFIFYQAKKLSEKLDKNLSTSEKAPLKLKV